MHKREKSDAIPLATRNSRFIQDGDLPGAVWSALLTSGELRKFNVALPRRKGGVHVRHVVLAGHLQELVEDPKRLLRIRNLGPTGVTAIRTLLTRLDEQKSKH